MTFVQHDLYLMQGSSNTLSLFKRKQDFPRHCCQSEWFVVSWVQFAFKRLDNINSSLIFWHFHYITEVLKAYIVLRPCPSLPLALWDTIYLLLHFSPSLFLLFLSLYFQFVWGCLFSNSIPILTRISLLSSMGQFPTSYTMFSIYKRRDAKQELSCSAFSQFVTILLPPSTTSRITAPLTFFLFSYSQSVSFYCLYSFIIIFSSF